MSLVRPPARLYLFWKFKIAILKEISSNYIFSEKKKYIYIQSIQDHFVEFVENEIHDKVDGKL